MPIILKISLSLNLVRLLKQIPPVGNLFQSHETTFPWPYISQFFRGYPLFIVYNNNSNKNLMTTPRKRLFSITVSGSHISNIKKYPK